MSTRSAIIVSHEGKYTGVYCHSDGYPEWNGNRLMEHFNSLPSALALVSLGDLSSIGRDGTVTAYHRDRGESWDEVKPIESHSLNYIVSCLDHDDNVYLFADGKWHHNGKCLATRLASGPPPTPVASCPPVASVKPGTVITFVCGPGESSLPEFAMRKGRAYGVIRDRWGTHLRVKLDDFTFTTVDRFTSVGIGAYCFA